LRDWESITEDIGPMAPPEYAPGMLTINRDIPLSQ
jgi:hypothetical protein